MSQEDTSLNITSSAGNQLEHNIDGRNGNSNALSQSSLREAAISRCSTEVMAHFSFPCLPRVVFLTILKFFETVELCRLCLVCKLWRQVCKDPSLWRNLELVQPQVSDEVLGRLTSLSNNVCTIKISQGELLTDSGMIHVLRNCPSLQELVLNHCYLSDEVLEVVGEYCRRLKKLDISLSINFSDYGVQKVCQGCSSLEELITDQCPRLTSDSLVALGNNSHNLKSISTERVVNITDNGLASLLQGCPRLQSLRVPFCSGLTNHCLPCIIEYCSDISWLDLRGMALADIDVCMLVQSSTKLVYLNLSLCYNLTDRTALEIGIQCKSIKHLFLVHNKLTDNGLLELGRYCKTLEHLDVSWCAAVTANGAKYILQGCPKLQHLGLVRCDRVSESAVDELSLLYQDVHISTIGTEMKKFLNDTELHENQA